ncbi:hypothetical protein MD484_g8930, partial [Candolleomyces efflorescens]
MNSTPLKRKATGVESFSSQALLREQKNLELAEETEARWLGPMPPEEFLSEFLPLPNGAQQRKDICFETVAAAQSEAALVASFIEVANKSLSGLTFVNTSASRNSKSERLDPDVTGVFDMKHVRYLKSKTGAATAEVDFGYSDLIVECKIKTDAFIDPAPEEERTDVQEATSGGRESMEKGELEADELPMEENLPQESDGQEPSLEYEDDTLAPPFESQAKSARAIRGQLATYASAQIGSQFRNHTFSLFIFGKFARFIRWDRSCAIVSARFEYGTSPNNYLADFLHRYSLLDDAGRGKDPTLSPDPCSAGDCPPELAEKLHKANKSRFTSASPGKTELRKVFIPDREDPNVHHPHIISYPLPFVTPSPFGRATRPFLAYNPATQRMVFAKDYWRPAAEGIIKEGDVYKTLKAKGVRHIAPFGHGNDLAGQETIDLSKYAWAQDAPRTLQLQHYRMSLKVIGARLQDFPSTRILVGAVADAMEGHDDAFWEAKILHRDISMGNILIAQDQSQYRGKNAPADEEVDGIAVYSGLLIDWDLSVAFPTNGPLRKERTGTWQFISAALLTFLVNSHAVEDDRESSFYVVLFGALRYSKHEGGDETSARLRMFDEVITRAAGLPTGGALKEGLITGTRPYPIKFNPPLDAIIAEATRFFRPRYTFPTEEEKAIYDTFKDREENKEILNATAYGRNLAGLQRMQARGEWVALLRRKLEEDGWPDNDFYIQPLKPIRKYQKRRLWVSQTRASTPATSSGNKRTNFGSGTPIAARPDQVAFDAEADAVIE